MTVPIDAFDRTVETRTMEGYRRDFLADPDIAAFFHGNVNVGPLLGDDEIVSPPQINISLLPGDVYEVGTGGVVKDRLPIYVKAYFPPELKSYRIGGRNPHDVVARLIMIVTRGSIDPCTGLVNDNGYVLDPDWPVPPPPIPTPYDPLRWLTTHLYGCSKQAALLVPPDKPRFLLIPFAIDAETKLNPLTRERMN